MHSRACAEPPNENFGRAWQSRDRIEVARVEQQRRRDQFVESPPGSAPRGDWTEVAGETPAGIEGDAMRGHRLSPQQRFKTGERAVDVHFVDKVDQCGNGRIANDLVGNREAKLVRDRPFAVPGLDVGVGFVDEVRIGRGRSYAPEQLEVARQARPAGHHGAVVLDLTWYENVPPRRIAPLERSATGRIFADAGGDDQLSQGSRAGEELTGKWSGLDELFELARPIGIEVNSEPVDDDRERRNAVSPKADGTNEAVFDLDELSASALEVSEHALRSSRFPNRDSIPGLHAIGVRDERHAACAAPE